MVGNLRHQSGVVTRARTDVRRAWAHVFLLFQLAFLIGDLFLHLPTLKIFQIHRK
jgi:hypothetical protein